MTANFPTESDASAAAIPVYGGSFADVWEARQDSDVLLEDGLGNKAATTIFDDGQNAYPEYQEQQQQQELPSPQHQSIRGFCHNPYSLTEPVKEVVACYCSACSSPAISPRRAMTFDSTGSAEHMTPEHSFNSNSNSFQQQDVALELPVAVEAPFSIRFMPPPPPRMDTCDVLHACGCPDADSVVYNLMTKWFAKVQQIQGYFLPETEFCPLPSPNQYTFGEWCLKANEWWSLHFANMQKKPVPQRRQYNDAPRFVPNGRSPRQQYRHQGQW